MLRNFTLPMLEWIDIPAGKVTLETGWPPFDGSLIEKTYSRLALAAYEVDGFAIARYPVTNAQFQAFVEDSYDDERWWTFSAGAQRFHRHNPLLTPRLVAPNLPREKVNWYEAIAFCAWLSRRSGLPVTLPTEMQWQRAAQGDDGREYPYGNVFDPQKCNTIESDNGHVVPVDAYPDGQSPFGVLDMAGNVQEWCLNNYDFPLECDLEAEVMRSTRGSSWACEADESRCAWRDWMYPESQDHIGFRLVTAEI